MRPNTNVRYPEASVGVAPWSDVFCGLMDDWRNVVSHLTFTSGPANGDSAKSRSPMPKSASQRRIRIEKTQRRGIVGRKHQSSSPFSGRCRRSAGKGPSWSDDRNKFREFSAMAPIRISARRSECVEGWEGLHNRHPWDSSRSESAITVLLVSEKAYSGPSGEESGIAPRPRRYTVDVYPRSTWKHIQPAGLQTTVEESSWSRDLASYNEKQAVKQKEAGKATGVGDMTLLAASDNSTASCEQQCSNETESTKASLTSHRHGSLWSTLTLPIEASPPTVELMEHGGYEEDERNQAVVHGRNLHFDYAHLYSDDEIEKIRTFVRSAYVTDFGGWLEKKNPIMWGYKTRYAEVKGFQMSYYKHRGDSIPRGTLDLTQPNWTLRLDTSDGATFTLKAEHQNRMYVWRVLDPADLMNLNSIYPTGTPGDQRRMSQRGWWFEKLKRKLKAVTFVGQLQQLVDPLALPGTSAADGVPIATSVL